MDGLPPLLEHKQLTGPPGCITPIGAKYDDRGRKLDTLGRVASPGSPRGHKKLSPKRRAFVDHYLKCNDMARAALRAGYSKKSARRIGQFLMAEPDVRAEIERRLADRQVDADRILDLLSQAAVFDPSPMQQSCYGVDDFGRRIVNWPRIRRMGIGHLVKQVDHVGKEGHEIIRWHSQMEAALAIAKILGMTRDRVEVSLTDVRTASDEELMALANLK